jgi:tRNA threonylcarbamoyl adenosine modification protein YeaZ
MKILALEFSSSQRSVAVLNAAPSGTTCFEVVETGGLGPLGMIEQALRNAGVEREQIERIAIGLGPGSYTGIRAAIALGQGWQLASGIKLLGISTAEALAEESRLQRILGRINIGIDAQRNEFYVETFDINEQRWQSVEPLHLTAIDVISSRLQAKEIVAGPDAHKLPGSRLLFPRAATLGAMAKDRNDFISGENLSPIYLRQTTFVKAPPPRQLPEM